MLIQGQAAHYVVLPNLNSLHLRLLHQLLGRSAGIPDAQRHSHELGTGNLHGLRDQYRLTVFAKRDALFFGGGFDVLTRHVMRFKIHRNGGFSVLRYGHD